MRPLWLSAVVAVYLAVCIADAGSASRNSIKNLQPGAAESPAEPVSASPHAPKTEPGTRARTAVRQSSTLKLFTVINLRLIKINFHLIIMMGYENK